MFRNQYDGDVTIWSPEGRIHQVEYAMEAVKHGPCTVGIRSNQAVVLVALKRTQNELSSYQPKIFEIDDFSGVSVAGLMTDARLLIRFLQIQAYDYEETHGDEKNCVSVPRAYLRNSLERKLHANTILYGRRPFGVGMLIVGYDDKGTYLMQTCPSSRIDLCKAMAIGARSQSAKTYLENHLNEFAALKDGNFNQGDAEALIVHALKALKSTLPNDMTLNERNTSVSLAVIGQKFKILNESEIEPILRGLGGEAPVGMET